MNKLSYTLFFALILIILNLMARSYYEIQITVKNLPEGWELYSPFIKLSLYGVLIGILLEWKKAKEILSGKIQINVNLLLVIILFVIGTVPSILYAKWFGLGDPYGIKVLGWLTDPLRHTAPRTAINILTGYLLVRSLWGRG